MSDVVPSEKLPRDPERASGESPPGYSHSTAIPPRMRKIHDSAVSFEEYIYYAKLTRQEQDREHAQLQAAKKAPAAGAKGFLRRQAGKEDPAATSLPAAVEQQVEVVNDNLTDPRKRMHISDEEWANASRALRTATWGAGFYLITTDILGPYGVGFAMGTLGWGPGIALYSVFGFMAGWSGYLICKVFLGLDSFEFPVRNYSDLAHRLYGSVPRYFVAFLQAVQLIAILGQVIIQNGQAISQVAKFRLCYAVCCVIFVVVGFFLGQVRTLRNWGWLSSASVAMNLLVIFMTMGVMAHSPPNYSIAKLGSSGSAVDPDSITPDPVTGVYPPIVHYNGLPNPGDFKGAINGLMSGVFAYGGAQVFVEIMSEMRRPFDFFKAMWSAQFFIYSVYLIYGCYVYYFQGQYAFQNSYQGVSPYAWQVVGDMLNVLSGLIAAGLYGNIGIKVFYNNVLMELASAPPLAVRSGKLWFAVIVPIWWTIAFIIAASVPDYFAYVSVVSALCVVQFSYSFPPIIAIGYLLKLKGMRDGDGFDPRTGAVVRSGTAWQRYWRGFVRGPWWMIVLHFIHAGGALATAGLGAYSAIEAMIEAFKMPQINAFTCTSPLDLNA